jgi:hypothetical protein
MGESTALVKGMPPVGVIQLTGSAVGRLLRRLRVAVGASVLDTALALECRPKRIRDLEAGRSTLGYLEGLRLAKFLGLCPQCFRRHVEAAAARDLAVDAALPAAETDVLEVTTEAPAEAFEEPGRLGLGGVAVLAREGCEDGDQSGDDGPGLR